jgi:hypothetical protein
MSHNRKLVVGGVSLVKERLKRTEPIMDAVRNEIEQVLQDSNFFSKAPFNWISMIIRYGLKNQTEPSYQPVNKKYKDLPIALEIDVHSLIDADPETMKEIFRRAIAKSLIHVGQKYNLPFTALKNYLGEAEGLQ